MTPFEKPTSLPSAAKMDVPVFTLEILILARAETRDYHARLANLSIAPVVKSTPREAIAAIVEAAKKNIRACLESNTAVAWLDPKEQPQLGESRMFVPIHL